MSWWYDEIFHQFLQQWKFLILLHLYIPEILHLHSILPLSAHQGTHFYCWWVKSASLHSVPQSLLSQGKWREPTAGQACRRAVQATYFFPCGSEQGDQQRVRLSLSCRRAFSRYDSGGGVHPFLFTIPAFAVVMKTSQVEFMRLPNPLKK